MNTKAFLFNAVMAWTLLLTPSYAQITSDGTTGSVVYHSGTRHQIDGGTIRGNTLFHSFSKFSIPTNNQAYFTNSSGINLILSRVTGKRLSNINGTLGVNGSADLFLMNPNGIIFGPNASLDVSGSFLATTGSSFVFEDGKSFSASHPTSVPNFKVSVPLGIQFGRSSAPITVQSQLSVGAGETISFLGGNLNFIGSNVSAPRGNIAIGSVDNGSYVALSSIPNGWFFSYQDIEGHKDINIKDSRMNFYTAPFFEGLSYEIHMNGKNISIDKSFVMTERKIDVYASKELNIYSGSYFCAFGDLFIDTEKLKLSSGGSLDSSGILNINAFESIEISGYKLLNSQDYRFVQRSGIYHSSWLDDSQAKGITINTDKILLDDGGVVQTYSYKSVGGDINVNANELSLSDGGKILSLDYANSQYQYFEAGPSQGGNINLNISGKISTSGKDSNATRNDFIAEEFGVNSSGIFSVSSELSQGRTGDISLVSKDIEIKDGAGIGVIGEGNGPTGSLYINGRSLILADNAYISLTGKNNKLGKLSIDIDEYLLAIQNSKITYNSQGIGIGDEVSISVNGEIFVSDDSDIIISAPRAEITINVSERTSRLNVSEYREIPVKQKKIAKTCRPGQALGDGHFVYKGTGGVPLNPYQLLTAPAVWQDLRLHHLQTNSNQMPSKPSQAIVMAARGEAVSESKKEEVKKPQEIVEAKGWVRDKEGRVILTANPQKYIANTSYQPSATC